MPSDIRSFFGGGGAGPKPAANSKKDTSTAKSKNNPRGRARKVVSDDEDDDVVESKPKKSTPAKPKTAVKEAVEEETTSSAYFASSKSKPAKSTPVKSKPATTNGADKTPTKPVNAATPSTGRRSTRKTAVKNYAEKDDMDLEVKLKDEGGGDDDIFDLKSRKKDDDYQEASEEDDVKPPKKPAKAVNGRSKKPQSDEEDQLEMAEIPAYDGPGDGTRKKTAASTSSARKRKSTAMDDDDDEEDFLDDDDDTPKKKSRKSAAPAAKKPRAPAKKKEEREESSDIQAILDNIPTVRAPTPPPRDENKKFVFGGGNADVAPPEAGSAEIPEGAENCLAGLTFVFTGVLRSLHREEGQNLVKRYGGKITGAPSKKTNYVVLGSEAGPKKLETIRNLGVKTINEEGLFALIRNLPANGGDGKAAEAYAEKQAKEEAKIRKQAEEMEAREKEKREEEAKAAKAAAARAGQPAPTAKSQKPKVDDRLWVDKYAPDAITGVCGNKQQVEGLQRWLRNWHNSAKANFKKAGADGRGVFRAALLHGPPGVGKTTAAHLVAKLEGFDVVESNASDTRNKKLLESALTGVLDTTSLLGYFAADGKKVDAAKKKLVLIMDEVDGMSAGDRGGVGAMAAIAKKTHIPLIMICNERSQPKMKPFYQTTAEFAFRRPTTDMIRGRIATILYREGMKLPMPVINALIEGCSGDIRQIINMISTVKLDNKGLDFSDTKAMSKAWEKHVILKPWDIVNKILRPQMFSASSTATLNEKTELYFNDHEFSYLMLQENYLATQPSLASSYQGQERRMKLLELADNAAASISDGDLVDRMIHGSQQQWSLMPTHAIFSFVRPASYVYGNLSGHTGFTSWLGQNSKQSKLSRMVKEVQGHMRLRSSADRHEVRQQYLPALWDKTVGALQHEGKEAVPDVIDFMDSYYLTKEDFDAVLELGVGPLDMDKVKLETATKATFTRLYNKQSHPMPFVKASNVLGMAKGTKRDKPDLEEAVDESEPDEILGPDAGDAEDDDEQDLKKDKYVKMKAAPKATAASKAKGKRNKGAENDDDDEESEEPPPKKKKTAAGGGRGGRKGKGKGKA